MDGTDSFVPVGTWRFTPTEVLAILDVQETDHVTGALVLSPASMIVLEKVLTDQVSVPMPPSPKLLPKKTTFKKAAAAAKLRVKQSASGDPTASMTADDIRRSETRQKMHQEVSGPLLHLGHLALPSGFSLRCSFRNVLGAGHGRTGLRHLCFRCRELLPSSLLQYTSLRQISVRPCLNSS